MLRLCALALAAALCAPALAGAQAPPEGQVPAEAAAPPPDPGALLARAVSLHQGGDAAGAAALYEQVLSLGGESPVLRSNLGAAYAQLGRYDDAIGQYQKALALDASNSAIRRNLALAYSKAGRVADAAGEAERLLAAQPDNVPAALLLADCRLRLGESARVVEVLAPLAGRTSQDRAVSYLLGMALLAEGRVEEAQAAIDRVLREDSAEAHVLLAAMYMKDEDCERALPEARAALERNPAVPLASSLLGRCLMDDTRNDFPGAIDAFRRELAGDPNHFESNLYLGSLLREGGQAEEALAFAERAARLRPADVAARFSLGAAYVALGRTEEAVPLLEQVVSVAPDHLPTQMQLAVAYHRLGRTEDSLRARAAVGRLQAEGENRFFKGVSDALSRLLGKTAPAGDAARDAPRP